MKSSFENLVSLNDAAKMWHLEQSTLRKAISSNKFVVDEDVKKFGKQWVIKKEAMERVYGYIDNKNVNGEIINDTKQREIYYFVFDCFNNYCRKYNLSFKKASGEFTKYNILNYLIECYDYLHLQNVNDTVKDIYFRIKRGIRYA